MRNNSRAGINMREGAHQVVSMTKEWEQVPIFYTILFDSGKGDSITL